MHFNVKISKNRLWSNVGKHHHGKNQQKICQCVGLSFEVYNSFLPQLASNLRAVESGSPEKVPEL